MRRGLHLHGACTWQEKEQDDEIHGTAWIFAQVAFPLVQKEY